MAKNVRQALKLHASPDEKHDIAITKKRPNSRNAKTIEWWGLLEFRPLQGNSLFPISRPHVDFLPAWSSIIAIKLISYSLFARDCTLAIYWFSIHKVLFSHISTLLSSLQVYLLAI